MRELEGNIFTRNDGFKPGKILINDSFIIEKVRIYDKTSKQFDKNIIPGLIDIHMHGAAGYDFCDATLEALEKIDKYEQEHGIVKFCGATMTLSEDRLKDICKVAKEYKNKCEESQRKTAFEGIYLEGPFISPNKCGAQNSDFIKKPDIKIVEDLIDISGNIIKYIVVAPEIEGAEEFIQDIKGKGICVSIGHTNADYKDALASINSGVKHITHLYNAMSPFNHRKPGVIGAAFINDDVETELIADGIHVHEAAVNLLFRIKRKDKIIFVSDSTMSTGVSDGMYHLGDKEIIKKGNRAVLRDGTLAGSATNLYDCMKWAINNGIDERKAISAATVNPARSLGIDKTYGSIEEGKSGHVIITDSNLEIIEVLKDLNQIK